MKTTYLILVNNRPYVTVSKIETVSAVVADLRGSCGDADNLVIQVIRNDSTDISLDVVK